MTVPTLAFATTELAIARLATLVWIALGGLVQMTVRVTGIACALTVCAKWGGQDTTAL